MNRNEIIDAEYQRDTPREGDSKLSSEVSKVAARENCINPLIPNKVTVIRALHSPFHKLPIPWLGDQE